MAKSLGYNVISLELKNADINTDILEWDYQQFDRNHFDFIWSSPPCTEYSKAKTTGIWNIEYANKEILKTEMIKYFNPKYFVIENPQTGLLKKIRSLWMRLILKMLTIVSMECLTERELATSGITNILKLRNVCQMETRNMGVRIM